MGRARIKGKQFIRASQDTMSGTGIEKVAALLAARVADRVAKALMKAGFDKEFANTLLRAFKEQIEKRA